MTKDLCFVISRNVLEASSTNSVDPDKIAPVGAALSWSTLFVSIPA